MFSGQSATAIRIVCEELMLADLREDQEDMAAPSCYESGPWRALARECLDPIGCEVELRDDLAEQLDRKAAATITMRATRRPPPDDPAICYDPALASYNGLRGLLRPIIRGGMRRHRRKCYGGKS